MLLQPYGSHMHWQRCSEHNPLYTELFQETYKVCLRSQLFSGTKMVQVVEDPPHGRQRHVCPTNAMARCISSNVVVLPVHGIGINVKHYSDIIMGTIASQITSLTIVYSTVYSDADQRKHQSSTSLAFVWGIHRGPVNSPHKWPVTRKMFPFNEVIMIPCGALCMNNLILHLLMYIMVMWHQRQHFPNYFQ